ALALHVDRQALTSGRGAHAVARVQLTAAGAPASLALLEQPSWELTLVDRKGISSTRHEPLALSDNDAAVPAIPAGEATSHVRVCVRGKVRVVSEQRALELGASDATQPATMHDTLATEAMYLAQTNAGWVLYALGKTGEPRGQRPLTVSLVHR